MTPSTNQAHQRHYSEAQKLQIMNALYNSRLRWRTAKGIANETDIPTSVVFTFLFNSQEIIISSKTNRKGEQLFALRIKYNKEISTKVRIMNAITHKFH